MDLKSENGAVIIEATLSLSFFMFAIITIYSMFHIGLAQARISSALNSTAKEISQYSYIYDMTGLNEKQEDIAAGGGAAESILSDSLNLSDVDNLYDAFSSIAGGASSIVTSPDNAESFLYYALNEGIDQVKGSAAGELTRLLMRKHFGSNPDAFLEGLGIDGGMSGLHFSKSRIFSGGSEDNITLNCQYKVTVVKLLDIDMKLNFELTAKTRAWIGSE